MRHSLLLVLVALVFSACASVDIAAEIRDDLSSTLNYRVGADSRSMGFR